MVMTDKVADEYIHVVAVSIAGLSIILSYCTL